MVLTEVKMMALLFAQFQNQNLEQFDTLDPDALLGILVIYFSVMGVLILLMIISTWKIYTKAGKPGWASIVPFYQTIVLLDICGRPWWWLFLLMIPFVNIIAYLITMFDLARNFGKGGGFAIGLIFLPFIFYPILAFSSDAQFINGEFNTPLNLDSLPGDSQSPTIQMPKGKWPAGL